VLRRGWAVYYTAGMTGDGPCSTLVVLLHTVFGAIIGRISGAVWPSANAGLPRQYIPCLSGRSAVPVDAADVVIGWRTRIEATRRRTLFLGRIRLAVNMVDGTTTDVATCLRIWIGVEQLGDVGAPSGKRRCGGVN